MRAGGCSGISVASGLGRNADPAVRRVPGPRVALVALAKPDPLLTFESGRDERILGAADSWVFAHRKASSPGFLRLPDRLVAGRRDGRDRSVA